MSWAHFEVARNVYVHWDCTWTIELAAPVLWTIFDVSSPIRKRTVLRGMFFFPTYLCLLFLIFS